MSKLITAAQLAPLLGKSTATVLRWAKEGAIPHRRIASKIILFDQDEIQRWLQSNRRGPAVAA